MRNLRNVCVALLVGLCLASCNSEPAGEYFTTIEYFIDEGAKQQLLTDINAAEFRLDVAMTRIVDTDIADAIVSAKERGVAVRMVADADYPNDAGMQVLTNADIRPTTGDGPLFYLPDPNIAGILNSPCGRVNDVVRCPEPANSEPLEYQGEEPVGALFRPGDFNLMSHNFVMIDVRTVWNFMRPFDGRDGPQFSYRAESERMREVFEREFVQLHGGVFSTTLDVYNGPTKSAGQQNPDFNAKSYLTDRGELELRFNPQDRVTKTIIDDTYRARASVYIVSDTIGEDFLVSAIDYKAKARDHRTGEPAFDVKVIVRDASQSSFTREQLLATGVVRFAPSNVEALPSVAIFDSERDADGDRRPRRVHVASNPLWRAGPFDIIRNDGSSPHCDPLPANTADCVVVHPADYFVDGNMWSLLEYRGQLHEVREIDAVVDWFEDLWAQSEAP